MENSTRILHALELVLLALEVVVFVFGVGFVGPRLVGRFSDRLARLSPNAIFTFGISLVLGLSILAQFIGLAAIIGAGIALTAGVVSADVYAAVPGTVLVATLVSPYLITAVFTRRVRPGDGGERRSGEIADA